MLPSGGAGSCAPALRAMEPATLGNAWISALDSLCLRGEARTAYFQKFFQKAPK